MHVDSKINFCATKISDSLNTYFVDLGTTCVTPRVINDQEIRPSWQVLGNVVFASLLAIPFVTAWKSLEYSIAWFRLVSALCVGAQAARRSGKCRPMLELVNSL